MSDEIETYGFSTDYIEKVFSTWYSHGRPQYFDLRKLLEPDQFGRVPNGARLKYWIDNQFKKRAEILDLEVRRQMDKKLISERTQILERHAKIGEEMQDMGIEFLREHRDELKVANAIKLLVEGIEIERQAKGLLGAMQALSEKSDDELLIELQKLISTTEMPKQPSVDNIVDSEFSDIEEEF